MTFSFRPALIVATVASMFSVPALADTTIINNVKGYTFTDGELMTFKALQFTDDKIDRIYKLTENIEAADDTKIIDGKGQVMLPGLIDAHGHVLNYGLSLMRVDLMGSESEQDSVQRVIKFAKKNPNTAWIQGRGWNQVQWPSNEFPTAASLDQAFPDTPVVLSRVDGHALWVNSKAMELAGIKASTKEVDGGQIIRDNNNQPTGVFVDNAMALIFDHIPALTLDEMERALDKSMRSLASLGLTSVHDAGISSQNIEAYQNLAKKQAMPIRINAMVDVMDPNWQQTLASGVLLNDDKMLQINSVKISADGALGSRGAALIEGYSDMPHHRGLLLHDDKVLGQIINHAMQAGFQVNTHAIGDNANKIVLDHYQAAIKQTNSVALRHRVEHAQVLQISDIDRFAELKVIASMQATHATSDKNMAEDRLGSERIKGAYAWKSLLDKGVVIAAGSDFPVESPNPFFGLHASLTRQDQKNLPKGGWYPEQSMTMSQAFKSFTLDAAYAGHQETYLGSLEPEKQADFILVDQDIFAIAKKNIWKTKVNQTWVAGKKVEF
ncbi:amidohydrolase [Thalassotalea mangrovi]|uniref:Amidohydrolase n=1 Tax=Thalassotalea mangrovi TaxID=2572245 RepID=A0A4U1B747_9GAMM|nr:amidohydrolase [Thalassotalea mangrovi]TKB46029.1 amidohydrolase [Thalassotalea mangrovi]